jgi:hypothetical protein
MAVKHKAQSAATLTVTDMIRHALSPRGQQELYQFRGECVYYDFQLDEFTLKPQFGCTIHFGWMPSPDDSESFSNLVERIVDNAAPKLYELQMGVPDPTEPLGFRDDNYMVTLLHGAYHPEVMTHRQWQGLAFDCLIERDTHKYVEESLGDYLPPYWQHLLTSTVPDVLAAALKDKYGAYKLLYECRLADLPTDDDDSVVSIIAIAISDKASTSNNINLAEAMRYGRQIIGRRNMLLTNDHRLQLMQVMEKIARHNNGDADLIEEEFLAWKELLGAEGTTRINFCRRDINAAVRDGVTYYAELPAYKSSGEIDRCLTADTYLQMLRRGEPNSPIEISTTMLELLCGSLAAYAGGSFANRLNLDHFKVVPTQSHDQKWLARSLQVAQLDWTLKTQA